MAGTVRLRHLGSKNCRPTGLIQVLGFDAKLTLRTWCERVPPHRLTGGCAPVRRRMTPPRCAVDPGRNATGARRAWMRGREGGVAGPVGGATGERVDEAAKHAKRGHGVGVTPASEFDHRMVDRTCPRKRWGAAGLLAGFL